MEASFEATRGTASRFDIASPNHFLPLAVETVERANARLMSPYYREA